MFWNFISSIGNNNKDVFSVDFSSSNCSSSSVIFAKLLRTSIPRYASSWNILEPNPSGNSVIMSLRLPIDDS